MLGADEGKSKIFQFMRYLRYVVPQINMDTMVRLHTENPIDPYSNSLRIKLVQSDGQTHTPLLAEDAIQRLYSAILTYVKVVPILEMKHNRLHSIFITDPVQNIPNQISAISLIDTWQDITNYPSAMLGIEIRDLNYSVQHLGHGEFSCVFKGYKNEGEKFEPAYLINLQHFLQESFGIREFLEAFNFDGYLDQDKPGIKISFEEIRNLGAQVAAMSEDEKKRVKSCL